MFQIDTNYSKLKTNLRLSINRLKLLEKKKSELAQKARKEIADYISAGKYERAKIRVESIIREDYMVEALELVELYCDMILSRFGLIQQVKGLDPSLSEAISSLLWVAPHLNGDIPEMKVINDQLTLKYGKKYTEACRMDAVDTVSEKLKHKLSIHAPPKILVEKYLIEIAKNYNVPYEPDPQVMREDEQARGIDALLFDNTSNNLGGEGGSKSRPPGFVGYPLPPLIPDNNIQPFSYPTLPEKSSPIPPDTGMQYPPASQPYAPPPPAAFSYNIPPNFDDLPAYDSVKPTNIPTPTNMPMPNNISTPPNMPANIVGPATPYTNSNNTNTLTDRNKQSNQTPKPLPRAKLTPPDNLPELPSVPSDVIARDNNNTSGGSVGGGGTSDDIDFDDLARRFEELKKRQ